MAIKFDNSLSGFDSSFGGSLGGFASAFGDDYKKKKERTTLDLRTVDDYKRFAEANKLKAVEEAKKPSLFGRTMDLLSRGTYASAGVAKALVKNQQGGEKENVLHEFWKGLSGKEKETYSDVLTEAGVKNRWVKGGLGFALDVAFDPTTYLGGGIMKGIGYTGKKLASGGYQTFKKVTKFNPEIAENLEKAGSSMKDAFNVAFNQAGRGSRLSKTKTFVDDLYRHQNIQQQTRDAAYDKWDDVFKELTEKEQDAFVKKVGEHGMQLPEIKAGIESKYLDKFNKTFGKAHPIKNSKHAESRLKSLENFTNKKVEYLSKKKDAVIKAGGGLSSFKIDDLKNEIASLRKLLKPGEVVEKTADDLIDVSDDAVKGAVDNFLNQEELKLKEILAALKLKDVAKAGDEIGEVVKGVTKKADIDYLEEVARIDKQIIEETNNLSTKISQLTTVTDARVLAKKQLQMDKSMPNFTKKERDFFLNKYKPETDRLSKMAGVEEVSWDAYYPSIKKELLGEPIDLGRAVSVGNKGYQKAREGILKMEDIISKPIEALSRREYEVARDVMNEDFLLNAVKTYGRPVEAFKDSKEAFTNGFKMLKTKKMGGKEVGWMKADDLKLVDEIMNPEMSVIDKLAKSTGYDAVTNFTKYFQTVPFPAFHMRNMASGDAQNYQKLGRQALNPKNHKMGWDVVVGKDKAIKFKNWEGSTKDLRKIMDENFGVSSRYVSDLGDPTKMRDKMKKWDPRKIGKFVEDYQKSKAMTTALSKGKNIDEAVKIAEEAGFDYAKITPFEQKVMKRFIPYYTFMRKNAELQLSTFAKHPERILNQKKIADSLSNIFGEKTTEEDLEGLPDWVLDGLGFKVSEGKYVSKLGLPVEEFLGRINDPFGSTLTSLNPIIKWPLEAKTGRDFFREQDVIDIKKVSPVSGKVLMDLKEAGDLPRWIDDALNIDSYTGRDGETKYTMSPKALHTLRNLPTARMQSTLEKIFDKDEDAVGKWLSFLSGGKLYDIDMEQQKYFKDRDMIRDIEDEALQKGIGTRYESFYVRK